METELHVHSVPLGEVHPDPANVRVHDARNLEAIKGSLARFGQQKPIVVDSDRVIRAGNGTYQAAQALGWETIQVIQTGLEGSEATAFAIADNRTSDLSTFDEEGLAILLEDLAKEDMGLEGTGYDEAELAQLLEGLENELAPRDLEDPGPGEAPVEPVSRQGDLWVLGDHRLLCGDSRNGADLQRLMGKELADLVWTDPPYGVEYEGKTKDALRIENDGAEGLEALLGAALGSVAESCHPGAAWYVAAPAGPQFAAFASVLGSLGIWRQTLVWVKDAFVLGHSDYHYRHEAIFYGWVPGAEHQGPPDRSHDSVWEFPRPRRSPDHPTSKPAELVARALELSSRRGSLVLDPFVGSGTTLIAAEQLGRRCAAIEIDPRYVDVALLRWEQATGAEALLHETGQTHAQVAVERKASS